MIRVFRCEGRATGELYWRMRVDETLGVYWFIGHHKPAMVGGLEKPYPWNQMRSSIERWTNDASAMIRVIEEIPELQLPEGI